jgi:lysophospholipase L1-like esterase
MQHKPRGLPTWKKIGFSILICVSAALLLYLPCELTYRTVHRIPLRLFNRSLPEDPRTLSDSDASAMDFNSVHYYEIFRPSANPILYYEPKPGFSKGAVQINTHGFRDHEYSLKKPTGTTRIVVLGDSIIWGHRLVLSETFAKQLEALLNERLDGHYEVLNFGVSGYSLQQEVEQYISKARQFDPDLAILGLCINDYLYSSIEGDFFAAQNGGLFSKSYLFNDLIVKVNYLLHHQFGVPQRYLEHIVDVRGQLERLQEASPNIPWLVLMFPQLQNVENYQAQREHQILTQPARDLGFQVRDLLGDYRKFSRQPLGVDHIHPNRLGNKIAAEAAYDALVRSGIISPAEQAADLEQD